ncbi:MAG: hypothetical protein HQM09_03170 [Candidatus Riflebacteria bacterium]|nr:hypothetical protein [Candidatus Riflebacteria bacterium]
MTKFIAAAELADEAGAWEKAADATLSTSGGVTVAFKAAEIPAGQARKRERQV